MKHRFLFMAAVTAAAFSIFSCNSDKGYSYNEGLVSALVTVKYEDSRCVFQVDDDTRVYPSNLTGTLYDGKEVRALTTLIVDPATRDLVDGQEVKVHWIDSILTKKTLPFDASALLGNDPLDIVPDWLTVAEDGYVTLHISTCVSGGSHTVNLVSGSNPENPYEFVLHHDAGGDEGGRLVDAVVAFNIREILSAAEAGETELTVRYDSYCGPQSLKLKARVK